MYILECVDGTYYTGSTIDLDRRLEQHQNGEGANYTQKRLPVKLVYFEEFGRIDDAFYREKQVQGWTRAKKEALIDNSPELLHSLSECKNDTRSLRSLSGAETTDAQVTKNRSLSGAETTDNEDLI
jgi:putative endonuclease